MAIEVSPCTLELCAARGRDRRPLPLRGADGDRFRSAVRVMAVMMRCCRWRRRSIEQLDWLAVGCVEIGLPPSLLALGDLGARRRILEPDDGLERGQPLPVVSSVAGLAGLLGVWLD